MTRRERGAGTIDQHGSRWRVRLRLPDGTRPSFYFDDEIEALAGREALVRELAGTGHDPRSRSVTLGAWGLRWLDARERTHRDADGDRQRWAYVEREPIGRIRLDALHPSHLHTWLDSLAGRGLARQTVANARTTLRAALRGAERARAITADHLAELLAVPMPAIQRERAAEMDERIVYLTDDQIADVLGLELRPDQEAAFVVATWTGLRAGELQGLRVTDVHFDERVLVVARSRRGPTKNGQVARVPLLEPAAEALRRWLAHPYRTRTPERARSELVWPAEDGGPHARGYDWGWADATDGRPGIARRAGVPAVSWRDLRHTCAVHLLRGTWAPDIVPRAYRLEEVSRFLRHSSIAVTERHYAHLAIDALPVGSALGSNGSAGAEFLSHTGDLNSGPTVYETGSRASDSAPLRLTRTHAGPAEAALVAVLRRLALGDAAGAVEAAAAGLAAHPTRTRSAIAAAASERALGRRR